MLGAMECRTVARADLLRQSQAVEKLPVNMNVVRIDGGIYERSQFMAMSPTDFKRWRKQLGLSQKDAADALGLKRRTVQYYENGNRDGRKVKIPKSVRLACYAIDQGIWDYGGGKISILPKKKKIIGRVDNAKRKRSFAPS